MVTKSLILKQGRGGSKTLRKERRMKMKKVFVVFLLVSIMLMPLSSSAAQERLVIQVWPGDFETNYEECVIKPFEEKYGVEVITTTGLEWYTLQRITEMIASGHPEVDIVQNTVSDHIRGAKMGLWEEVNYKNINNAQDVHEQFKSPDGIGFETYLMGLIYNERTGKPVPNELADMWNPIYKVTICQTHEQYLIPMINHMITGHFTPVDLDAVFNKLEELTPQIVTINPSHSVVRTLIANNEIDLSEGFNNRTGTMIDDGMQVKFIDFPSAFVGVDYWNIVKGTSNKELAEKFINFTLAPEQQLANAEKQYLGPTNNKVKLDNDIVAIKGIAYGSRLENIITIDDYKYIADNLDEWTTRWQKWLAGF